MKKLIKTIALIVICIFVSYQIVYSWEIEGRAGQLLYNDSEIRAGNSVEIRVKHKGLFIFGEQDNLLSMVIILTLILSALVLSKKLSTGCLDI